MIPKDYKYLDHTRGGNPVLEVWQDRYGYLNIVGFRPNAGDYFTARAYDPTMGNWQGQGGYMYESVVEARTALLKGGDGPYREFDPENPLDVKQEYEAQFNWNDVDNKFLRENDHRMPGYAKGQMENSSFHYYASRGYAGNGKNYPLTEEGFEELKRDFRKANAPQRSMNVKKRETRYYNKGRSNR